MGDAGAAGCACPVSYAPAVLLSVHQTEHAHEVLVAAIGRDSAVVLVGRVVSLFPADSVAEATISAGHAPMLLHSFAAAVTAFPVKLLAAVSVSIVVTSISLLLYSLNKPMIEWY